MSEEVWKDITGYEGVYQVSNMGRVKSLSKKRILYQHNTSNGYLQVHLSMKGKVKYEYVHRIVASTFCEGKSEQKNEVNHIDGNRINNLSQNLEWCTRTENHRTDLYIARQKEAKHAKTKKVQQFNMNGDFIAEHFGIHEAHRATGVQRHCISKCCRKLSKHAGNFLWQYA